MGWSSKMGVFPPKNRHGPTLQVILGGDLDAQLPWPSWHRDVAWDWYHLPTNFTMKNQPVMYSHLYIDKYTTKVVVSKTCDLLFSLMLWEMMQVSLVFFRWVETTNQTIFTNPMDGMGDMDRGVWLFCFWFGWIHAKKTRKGGLGRRRPTKSWGS